MVNFLSQITDFIMMIVNMVITFFKGLLALFEVVFQMFGFIGSFASSFPPYVWAFFAAILAVSVIYIIVGR